jgi:hypothetical protein
VQGVLEAGLWSWSWRKPKKKNVVERKASVLMEIKRERGLLLCLVWRWKEQLWIYWQSGFFSPPMSTFVWSFFFCPRLSLAQDPCVICCWCSFILCLLVPQMPILAKDYGPGVTIGDKIEGVLKDYNGLLFYFIFFIFFPSPSIFFSSSPVFPLFSLMFSVFSFFFFLIVAFLWLL